ncbi:hypothetical protein ACVWYZ_001948, partial [Thermostichus sp. MS-CIW-37]
MAVSRKALSITPKAPCQSRGSLWLHFGHLNTFAPPNLVWMCPHLVQVLLVYASDT